MLLFIGGAARTGKSILARRLLHEMQMPYLNLDVLKMGLARGVPEFSIDPNAGAIQVAERLWPLVREMSHSLLVDRVDYVIEGEILPWQVATLRRMCPAQVNACFLGYATMTPGQKLHNIRTHAGYPNDWSSACSDSELLKIIDMHIIFSRYLVAECAIHHVAYFDTSHQFSPALDAVVDYVRQVRSASA